MKNKTHTVGRLAKRFGLSRSTLLYYDYIGLLCPKNHQKGSYRQYTNDDVKKLRLICVYRDAGVSLKDISTLLNSKSDSEITLTLKQRLHELSQEKTAIQKQQHIILKLLNKSSIPNAQAMSENVWKSMFQHAGISSEEMQRWHSDFERISPEKHTTFLQRLHMSEEEIAIIRAWSPAPHKILKLKKVSDNYLTLFLSIYENIERKGPGSLESTQRALSMCKDLPESPRIIDLGCGNGIGTINLVKTTNSNVIALDIHQPYLSEVRRNAESEGLGDRIIAEVGDMENLRYEFASFDLIWSEGSAYIMGFDAALKYWKQYLRPKGYMVLSEATWLKKNVPDDLRSFWAQAYPAMRNSENNIKAVKDAGYKCLGNFVLPQKDWDFFYDNLERHVDKIAPKYANSTDGQNILRLIHHEIELFRKCKGYYSYEFYVVQKS